MTASWACPPAGSTSRRRLLRAPPPAYSSAPPDSASGLSGHPARPSALPLPALATTARPLRRRFRLRLLTGGGGGVQQGLLRRGSRPCRVPGSTGRLSGARGLPVTGRRHCVLTREDLCQSRGATQGLIDALPTYKFKPKRSKNWGLDHASSSENLSEGGILGPGTKKERIVSAEDAVCCICLAKYGDDDELCELPCTHFFHVQCVNKWLKINAVCPLCKTEIGGVVRSIFGLPFGRRRVDRMAGRGVVSSKFTV